VAADATKTDTRAADVIRDFKILSSIGATGHGGVDREAATISDGQARTWLTTWMRMNGFDVRVDPIGNIYGMRTFVPGAPYILLGSHLDSQPTAGAFDGAYGVLAAAHAAQRVAAAIEAQETIPAFNLAVVDWFNEEGSRFAPSMMGSSVFTGKMTLADAHAIQDASGITVLQALETIGFKGQDTPPTIAAYLEIHVEQGKDLAASGTAIGLVESNWAARKFSLTVLGDQAHTGSCPMEDRKDALLGASLFVAKLRALADEFPRGQLHTSVGQLSVQPNSPVVVASRVDLLADIRSADEDTLAKANERVQQIVVEVAQLAHVQMQLHETHQWGIQRYQEAGIALCERVLSETGLSYRRTVTLAGHDSTNMKDVVPTVMLFVPSENGVSHNEREYTKDADLVAGVEALERILFEVTAGRAQEIIGNFEPCFHRSSV
jgi:N-carbamoyl-L-amino-acid hydrolase